MTTPLFDFTIPHTPVAKGRARSRIVKAKKGPKAGEVFASHYTPAETRHFEALVRDFAAQAKGGAAAPPLTCPVDLVVEFRFAIPASWPAWRRELAAAGLVHHTKKPDCSNLVKAIEDACNGVLFADDGQVVGCITDKVFTPGAEGIRVRGYRRLGLGVADPRIAADHLATVDPGRESAHKPLAYRLLGGAW